MSDEQDLRRAVADAFRATDSATAWYLDRAKLRVVHVRHGEVSDPLLDAADVEDDELRFVEIPAVTEAEIHEWMAEFVIEYGDPKVTACLDEKKGANARFELRLTSRAPDALVAWHKFLHERVLAAAAAWTERSLSEPIIGDGVGLAGDD